MSTQQPLPLDAQLEIAKLARQLHSEGQQELSIELAPDSPLYTAVLPEGVGLIEKNLVFASRASLNLTVALAEYARLEEEVEIDIAELFDTAYSLWRDEIGNSDQASGRLLALAANNIDLFAVAADKIRSGARVFDVLHLLEAAIPFLERISPRSLMDLCSAKYDQVKGDFAGGHFHQVLESWLVPRPQQAVDLRVSVLANLNEVTATLLGNAVVAISHSNFDRAVELAKADVESKAQWRAEAGVWALGRLLLKGIQNQESLDAPIRVLIQIVEAEPSNLRIQAIQSAVAALHMIPDFDDALGKLGESGDQDVLCAVATALFLKSKEFRHRGIVQLWLSHLVALKPTYKGALRDMDYAMSLMLKDPANAGLIIPILTRWVANHGQERAVDKTAAELFDDTIRALSNLDEYWSSMVTDWLLSDRIEHPAALAGILSKLDHRSTTKFRFDTKCIDQLSPADLLFLARRTLGYVHDRFQLTALSLSLLDSKDSINRIHPMLRELLVEEIGYDYPSSTSAALRKAAEEASDAATENFMLDTATAIDQLIATQDALPELAELRPPAMLQTLFARARAKQMAASFEEASKHSIFRQIATEIPVKAGSGTFSYRDSNYGPSMKFTSMSHSIEFPRREVHDPIGNSIRQMGFRLAKRHEQ